MFNFHFSFIYLLGGGLWIFNTSYIFFSDSNVTLSALVVGLLDCPLKSIALLIIVAGQYPVRPFFLKNLLPHTSELV